MNIENKILFSRFMTRSGDQAWDFAVPLVLIQLFPTNMRVAFIYFFVVKLGTVIFMPMVGRHIDNLSRKRSLQLGIGIQTVFVFMSATTIHSLSLLDTKILALNFNCLIPFALLVIFGFLSTVGANIMDISVASDLVPSVLTPDKLPSFNSRFRRLDLLTEVTSPIIAGSLLLISSSGIPLLGFYLILCWNIISFYPEYLLLNQIISEDPPLNEKNPATDNIKRRGFIEVLNTGWTTFTKQPISMVIISYALLWISVLSPHGVLLTAFLKSGWSLPEPLIGVFRASGAIFGLCATFLYPRAHKRFGLVRTSKFFIIFQAAMVFLALISFLSNGFSAQVIFLIFILLSRVGLYGFSLAETELRQISIPEKLRGEINGVASSLTSLATLLIFGIGIFLSSKQQFKYLVFISASSILAAAIVFNLFLSKSYYNSLVTKK